MVSLQKAHPGSHKPAGQRNPGEPRVRADLVLVFKPVEAKSHHLVDFGTF